MARGVIYAMSTVVPGLVKLGRTEEDGFEDEMKRLEGNGYANIAGLRREHAILVDDAEDKMELLKEAFGSVRIPGTDLYAVDAGLVSRLLSSFRGKRIYPEEKARESASCVPDGEYVLDRMVRRSGMQATARAIVRGGVFVIPEGTAIIPDDAPSGLSDTILAMRHDPECVDGAVTQKEIAFRSPSSAAMFVLGHSANGWAYWKTKDGEPIDVYRRKGQRE